MDNLTTAANDTNMVECTQQAVQKLEELIVESHARRMRYYRTPARDIVQENDLQSMLKERKDVRGGLLSNSNQLFCMLLCKGLHNTQG